MLGKKPTIYGMVVIVAVSLGGTLILTGDVDLAGSNVQTDAPVSDQRFSGVYPKPPPLQAQKVISKSIDLEIIKKQAGFTLLEPELPKGFVLLSATYDPIHDEATMYYGPQHILPTINDRLTMDDLLDLGIVVIDYERRSNMKNIDKQITKYSQNEKGAPFNVNGKKGYSIDDGFVDRQRVVIFDETESMEITVVYNGDKMSQVKNIAESLYPESQMR